MPFTTTRTVSFLPRFFHVLSYFDLAETSEQAVPKSQYQTEIDLISANKHRTDAFSAFEYKAGFQVG